MAFADRVDQGYRKFRNPYHNPNHAADVAQTTHFFICQTGYSANNKRPHDPLNITLVQVSLLLVSLIILRTV